MPSAERPARDPEFAPGSGAQPESGSSLRRSDLTDEQWYGPIGLSLTDQAWEAIATSRAMTYRVPSPLQRGDAGEVAD
jgi:hypothetical protein